MTWRKRWFILYEHRALICTSNVTERLNREIRHRTRRVVAFPAGKSALMRVCTQLSYRRYSVETVHTLIRLLENILVWLIVL